ncbi:MAG: DUF1385 domain-containing protein, partial [Syntrophomonadaceae bacterium]|nr:DUF1385 domain-containing protein [Syntrophomonadaceae bacterium]
MNLVGGRHEESTFQYGGQAVIEGVLMRGKRDLAIAIRRPDASILVEEERLRPWGDRLPLLRLPVLRGFIILIETLVIGLKALNFSASQAAEAEGEEITPLELVLTLAVAFSLAILLFIAVPTGAVHLLREAVPSVLLQNLIEGVLRLGIFLLYVVAISRMPDIRRFFEYHGAEHKVIHTYEAGSPLTVEAARQYSVLHPRCGTSFLLMVMVVAIVVFSLVPGKAILASWGVEARG